ncbi:MAG: ABC transporter permease [Gemmatimonadetes bacterium]|nr:ABC transporter permease [Gemmatimonadota bacterium]
MLEMRMAVRRLRRRPVSGAAAALTLALGIGAVTAAFAAVDATLLRDLPVRRQDELVVVWRLIPARGALKIPFGYAGFEVVERGVASLSGVAGVPSTGLYTAVVDPGDETYVLQQARVAGDLFGVLGVTPARGRLLTRADDEVGAPPVAVLSYAAWRSRFAADPRVIGTLLPMNDVSFTIVGVAPARFDFPRGTDVWVTYRGANPDWAVSPNPPIVEMDLVGRLSPGANPAIVAADIASAFATNRGRDGFMVGAEPVVVAFEELLFGVLRPVLVVALAAALLLLLAAVANATLLLLAGGSAAAHEVAVRTALGAARTQLVARLLADAGLVAGLGCVGGLVIAWVALRVLAALTPADFASLESVALDGRSLALALAVAAAAAVVAGSSAGLIVSRHEIRNLLAASRSVAKAGSARFQRAIAALQVALTVVSAVGAGLLIRTVATMDRLDPGLDPRDLTVVDLDVPYWFFEVPESYLLGLEQIARDLEARPDIIAVRPTLGPPLQQRLEVVLRAEGQTDEEQRANNPYVAVDVVLPGHFQAMGMPLRRGRGITEADDLPNADPVVVLDEVLARILWPGEDPLGKRINGFGYEDTWFTVVGVVAATRYRQFLNLHPRAYYPLRRMGNQAPSTLLVRTAGPPVGSVAGVVREAFARVDPQVRVLGEERMSDVLRRPAASRRFAASVLLFFACVTLSLAALGIYGVFMVLVQDRTREMGLRLALGAQRLGIVRLVLAGILGVAAVGAGAGLIVALWSGRLLRSLLYGVLPTDPPTLAVVLLGTVLLALLAGLVPALQASRVDPAVTLRSE